MTPADLTAAQRRHLLAMLEHGATPVLYARWHAWLGSGGERPNGDCTCGGHRGAFMDGFWFDRHGVKLSATTMRALERHGLVVVDPAWLDRYMSPATKRVRVIRLPTRYHLTEAGELLARLMDAVGASVEDPAWPRAA